MADPGGLFMFGVYGRKPTRDAVALFRESGARGVLLLARNIESPAQTRAFIKEFEQKLGRPLLFAIDHEGGWVTRFQDGMTTFPGNAALGRVGSSQAAREVGAAMARELAALGIRMNLAPVIDVESGEYNPGIGIRSFGRDPRLVARLGAAFIDGSQSAGVAACAKHFPGTGAAKVDPHRDLPTIKLPRAEILRDHIAPFARAAKTAAAIMTSHIRVPALDKVPATFSKKIVSEILRGRMKFKGLIISDDLCMGAISRYATSAHASAKAFDAGHDMLLIAHDEQGMRDSVDALRAVAPPPEKVRASLARIDDLLSRPLRAAKPNRKRAEKLSSEIAADAVSILRRGSAKIPLRKNARTLVLIPNFSQARDLFTFEGGPAAAAAAARLAARGASFASSPILGAPSPRLNRLIQNAEAIVFLCFEARRFNGQAATLRLLSKTAAAKTVVALLRGTQDISLCAPEMTVVDAAGFRRANILALWTFIWEDL